MPGNSSASASAGAVLIHWSVAVDSSIAKGDGATSGEAVSGWAPGVRTASATTAGTRIRPIQR